MSENRRTAVLAGPARCEAIRGMDTRQQRQEHRQRNGDVECTEQRPEPPGGALQQANVAA